MSEGQNSTNEGQNPAGDRSIAAEGLVGLRRAATASPNDFDDSFTITSVASLAGGSIIVTSNDIVKRPEIPEAPDTSETNYSRFEKEDLPPKSVVTKNKKLEVFYQNYAAHGLQLNETIDLLVEFALIIFMFNTKHCVCSFHVSVSMKKMHGSKNS